jgi:hypothetical protein
MKLPAGIMGVIVGVHCSLSFLGCRPLRTKSEPRIEFTRIPEAGHGSPDRFESIGGRVVGAGPDERLVLYALSGVWWVQPIAENRFTAIQKDSSWNNQTHPGTVYAALLVDARYEPPLKLNTLPPKGGSILAVATVNGARPRARPPELQFGGYAWEVRQSSPDGSGSSYDRSNVWVDNKGFLHLRISGEPGRWVSGEVRLSRSLGYGSYRFVVGDVDHLDPAVVFAISTSDTEDPTRAMDIQISQWGQPDDPNAQFEVQPWDVPANSIRFWAPSGQLTYGFKWEPGRVAFEARRAASPRRERANVAGHVFTSGIPPAGGERLGIAFYVYDHSPRPLLKEAEIVIEAFEFLP